MPKSKKLKYHVRCLGPGPEHCFATDDKTRHRRCPDCERKIKELSLRQTENPRKCGSGHEGFYIE